MRHLELLLLRRTTNNISVNSFHKQNKLILSDFRLSLLYGFTQLASGAPSLVQWAPAAPSLSVPSATVAAATVENSNWMAKSRMNDVCSVQQQSVAWLFAAGLCERWNCGCHAQSVIYLMGIICWIFKSKLLWCWCTNLPQRKRSTVQKLP